MKNILILMTTYNGEMFIEEQINSIIQQDYPCSVVILDDCSIDSTYEKITRKIKNLNNFELNQNIINNGTPGENFFRLLKENINKNFEYFSFSDQDDFWEKDKLSRAIELLSSTGSDFYCSELNLWDGANVFSKTNKKGTIKRFDYLFQSASAGCTCVISRKLAEHVVSIIEDENFKYWRGFSHDWFLYFIARVNKYQFIIDEESRIKYRIHENNNFGTLSIFKPQTFKFRLMLLSNGWYRENLINLSKYTGENIEAKNFLDLVLSKKVIERAYVVFRNGREIRRHFLHRLILQVTILFQKM